MPAPRLRQLVLAAPDLDAVVPQLRSLLAAPEPYEDQGVGEFGLRNAVLNAGGSFVEVVAPTRPGTAAGRWLERRAAGGTDGGGGYMLLVEVPDSLPGAQATAARLDRLGVRVVWEAALPDVVDRHLHPRDVGGTLLALDAVDPPGSWRWGGPAWTGTVPPATGGLREVEVAAVDPAATARRWAEVLDLPVPDGPCLALDGGAQALRFTSADEPVREGIVAATLVLADRPPRTGTVAGVRLRVEGAT